MAQKNDQSNYVGGKVLEGLSGIRARLSMYIGSTGVLREGHMPRALTQMMQEVISNSADEYLAGFGDSIEVTLNADGSATILDHGRGLPKGPGSEFTNVINMLTKAHASGKFDDSNYAALGTAGMNGIGLKATNSGSKFFEVEAVAARSKKSSGKVVPAGGNEHYVIRFQQEKALEKKIIKANTDEPTFTRITFLPDDGPISEDNPEPVLASTEWVVKDLIPRLESTAFLMDGLRITLRDERENHEFEQTWVYEHGIEDYLAQRLEGSDIVKGVKEPIVIRESTMLGDDRFELKAAFTWTEDFGNDIVSYANGVPTPEGGPHLDGFKSALAEAFRNYGEQRNITKKRLDEDDVLDGLAAVFEVRVPARLVDFEGQTKEKLGTVEAKKAVAQIIADNVPKWLFDNEKTAKLLIDKMKDSQSSRAAAMKARREAKAARKSGSAQGKLIKSSKLKECTSKNPAERELYIVEGESASKIGRDPKTQAVFQLRGKILNAYKADLAKALSNVEISTIAATLDAGIGREFDVEQMSYHKVIICTDQDPDGLHIRMLLTGLFSKFFPGLIDAGMLYFAKSPLYRAVKYVKGQPQVKMFYSESDFAKARPSLAGFQISRYKGLGELELEEAHQALTNPETRTLVRIAHGDANEASHMLKTMLGNNAQMRKEWIYQNIDFENTNDIEAGGK